MRSPPLYPRCSDLAPTVESLTSYDQEHLVTYLRLLDAYADGTDWQDVASLVLHIDPRSEPERARSALQSHLSRARWMDLPVMWSTLAQPVSGPGYYWASQPVHDPAGRVVGYRGQPVQVCPSYAGPR
jgi:hypothetical protein